MITLKEARKKFEELKELKSKIATLIERYTNLSQQLWDELVNKIKGKATVENIEDLLEYAYEQKQTKEKADFFVDLLRDISVGVESKLKEAERVYTDVLERVKNIKFAIEKNKRKLEELQNNNEDEEKSRIYQKALAETIKRLKREYKELTNEEYE